MPVTPEFRKDVESHLARISPTRSKAMFGGVALYSGEYLYGILDDDRIYFKVDETNIDDYIKMGSSPWTVSPGKVNAAYYEVPKEIWEIDMRIAEWISKAVKVAMHKAEGKNKKKSA